MGRKKIIVSDLQYDNEPLDSKIASTFSTESIIKHFNKNNLDKFRQLIQHDNIQLILGEKALMNTIYAFFDNNLNTSITSDKAFMHRNTLNYRLDKIQRYTGLNIRLFEHALLLKNLILIDNLIKEYDEIRRRKNEKLARAKDDSEKHTQLQIDDLRDAVFNIYEDPESKTFQIVREQPRLSNSNDRTNKQPIIDLKAERERSRQLKLEKEIARLKEENLKAKERLRTRIEKEKLKAQEEIKLVLEKERHKAKLREDEYREQNDRIEPLKAMREKLQEYKNERQKFQDGTGVIGFSPYKRSKVLSSAYKNKHDSIMNDLIVEVVNKKEIIEDIKNAEIKRKEEIAKNKKLARERKKLIEKEKRATLRAKEKEARAIKRAKELEERRARKAQERALELEKRRAIREKERQRIKELNAKEREILARERALELKRTLLLEVDNNFGSVEEKQAKEKEILLEQKILERQKKLIEKKKSEIALKHTNSISSNKTPKTAEPTPVLEESSTQPSSEETSKSKKRAKANKEIIDARPIKTKGKVQTKKRTKSKKSKSSTRTKTNKTAPKISNVKKTKKNV